MKNISLVILFFVIHLLGTVNAEPIARAQVAELFANPENFDYKISPDGASISFLERNKGLLSITIIDTGEMVVRSSKNFERGQNIRRYEWLSDEILYFEVVENSTTYNFIADVSSVVVLPKQLMAEGKLVDPLQADSESVLFQTKIWSYRNFYRLHEIKLSDLVRNEFRDSRIIETNYDNTLDYIYDSQFDQIMAIAHERDDIIVRYKRRLGSESWREIKFSRLNLSDDDSTKLDSVTTIPIGFAGPDSLAVLTNFESDKIGIRTFNVITNKYSDVLYEHPLYDLTYASFSDSGKLRSVSYIEHGLSRDLYFEQEIAEFNRDIRALFPGQELVQIDSSLDGKRIIYGTIGSDEPGQFYLYNDSTKNLETLESKYPQLDEFEFSPSQKLAIPTADGETLEAFLNLPLDGDAQALIVMPHGGPIGVQETSYFDPQIQYLTAHGFAVLRVNFRGSAGFGREFRRQGVGQFGRQIESDVTAAVDHVTQLYSFNRYCSMGSSYGGYSAVMLAMMQPERYQCVVAQFGIYDLPLLFNSSNYDLLEKERLKVERAVGEFDESLYDYSPVYQANKLQAPILLIAGEKDRVAPFEHTHRFEKVLDHFDQVNIETIFHSKSGHGHSNWFNDRVDNVAIIDFIQRSLKLPEREMISPSNQDLIVLANGYFDDEIVMKTSQTPLKILELVAQSGDGKAMYRLGQALLAAATENYEPERALEWMAKSAAAGHKEAMLWQAREALIGTYGAIDLIAADKLITQLEAQQKTAQIQALRAQSNCMTTPPSDDIRYCVALLAHGLNMNNIPRNIRNEFVNGVARALMDFELSINERERLQKAMQQYGNTNLIAVGFDAFHHGLLNAKARRGELDESVLVDDSLQIDRDSMTNDTLFGILFNVNVGLIERQRERTLLMIRTSFQDEGSTHWGTKSIRIMAGNPEGYWMFRGEQYKTISRVKMEIFNENGDALKEVIFDLQ